MPWPDNGQAIVLTRQGDIVTASLVEGASFTMTNHGGRVDIAVEGRLDEGRQWFVSLAQELGVGP